MVKEFAKLTTIIRMDYDNNPTSNVLQDIISLGSVMRIRDIILRQRTLRHFHVTLYLRKPIALTTAIELVRKHTRCDREYLDYVKNADGFSIRETPDYRDVTSTMEQSLYNYFLDNGCPDDWIKWFSFMDNVAPKRFNTKSQKEIDVDTRAEERETSKNDIEIENDDDDGDIEDSRNDTGLPDDIIPVEQ